MPEPATFKPALMITDGDVRWACAAMRLPIGAFGGVDDSDPRLAILKCVDSLDVEACPGSGKTTLLVAKLAILARYWSERRRGICVLSHTNVARREIEARLGNTAEGRRILAYPHFVGTIHGFVNEFLALPWLRSKGLRVRMIDDDACQLRRWRCLQGPTREGLEKNHHDQRRLKIVDADFSLGEVRWGKGALGPATRTYLDIRSACRRVFHEGYFCYDEMFVWARELLERSPSVRTALRHRFPILLVDEVQDNSELQSAFLWQLFSEGQDAVLRQRFGDANQAIYEHGGEDRGATTDSFPNSAIRSDIPSSHRFGPSIARLAGPLAVVPHALQGTEPSAGSTRGRTADKHAILLFDRTTVGYVLEAYARYLTELFTDEELRAGVFKAIGGVHRPTGDDNMPRTVSHYWPEYDYQLAGAEPKPRTLSQHLMAGKAAEFTTGEAHWFVEHLAEGVLRLAAMLEPKLEPRRRRRYRQMLDSLADKPQARAESIRLFRRLAAPGTLISENTWGSTWACKLAEIAETISGRSASSEEASGFLKWGPVGAGQEKRRESRCDNIFRYPAASPRVAIRVGSIHSAKGETHTATLVLETYYYTHQLEALRPWLVGERSGGRGARQQECSRLRQHYVAMTRPTHLLCLALQEHALSITDLGKLKAAGWRVARVEAGRAVWL